jgi:hypothetical protein
MKPSSPTSNTARARVALFLACIAPCACLWRGRSSTDRTSSNSTVLVDAPAGDSIQIVTDQPTYHAGDMIALRLVNRTSRTWGYNACTRTLQRNRVGVWLTVTDSGRLCTMQESLLRAGAAQTARTTLDTGLVRGDYRVVIRFAPESAEAAQWIAAASNSFRVE